ncbi:MAG: SufB/SufD family protein [Schwartzia sp. (in: firmicutes)]
MAEQEVVYSAIPMRTWRWLGVNEARAPKSVATAAPVEQHIVVPPGEKAECVVVYREEPAAAIRAEIAEGAALHLIRVQLAADDQARADRVEADVAAGGCFRFTAVEAGGRVSTSSLDIALSGRGSKADVAALYFADGTRRTDMNYTIRQKAPETNATMRVYGALAGEAEKIFRGTLDFTSGSAGSVGRESEEVILLSPKVRNRSVPLMLSGEADVDGHHAVTIGKMDENKLFYLMSRGLDGEEAKKLVVEAALAPVLSRLSDAALAEEIRAAIEGRLSHA